jgi:hypothetical protein
LKFILITGPQAVGKMTVGKAIMDKTGLRLFHNHMSIEPILQIFDYHTKEAQYLIRLIREEIFKTMASSDGKGMIFTYMWDFNLASEYVYVDKVFKLFESHGATTYIVELESDLETRLERNKTPLRLAEKPTKRNVEWSERELLSSIEKYRLNSSPGEIKHPNYLRINNTDLSPEEVADQVIEYFEII